MLPARTVIGKAIFHRTAIRSSRHNDHLRNALGIHRYSTGTESSSTGQEAQVNTDAAKTGGFAKAFEKQSQIVETKEPEENHTFASLLRRSKLMDVSL